MTLPAFSVSHANLVIVSSLTSVPSASNLACGETHDTCFFPFIFHHRLFAKVAPNQWAGVAKKQAHKQRKECAA
jgi:hypothetical protein